MELLALYVAIVALIVAIPGTIDATWNVIAKLRALKKDSAPQPLLPSKKSSFGVLESKKESFPRPTSDFQKNEDARPLQALCLVLAYLDITHPDVDHFAPRLC